MDFMKRTVIVQETDPSRVLPKPEIIMDEFWAIDENRVLNPIQGIYAFTFTVFFTAFHQVLNPQGKMGEVHPHSFRLNVKVQAKAIFQDQKIVLPYENIREMTDKISAAYEGKLLNGLPPFKKLQPTTENLTGVIWQQLEYLSKIKPFKVLEITLMESPTVGITFSR